MRRIVLASGGTGGHIVPAVSLYRSLSRDYECVLFTDARFLSYREQFPDVKVFVLPIQRRGSGLRQLMGFCVALCHSCVLSYFELCKFKPDLVIGFGAYISFPVLFAAKCRSIDIIVHEQNAILGRTNRFFAKYARVVASGLPLRRVDNEIQGKCAYIGTPVNMLAGAPFKMGNMVNLALLGGSQGLCGFGKIFAHAIAMLPQPLRERIFVTQQCSNDLLEEVKSIYRESGVKCRLSPFFLDMENILHNAHLVVSRAGATTIAEVMLSGRPAIYVPYRYSAHNHQLHNAKFVENLGAAICVEEQDLTVLSVLNLLVELLASEERLLAMATNASKHSMGEAAANFHLLIRNLLQDELIST